MYGSGAWQARSVEAASINLARIARVSTVERLPLNRGCVCAECGGPARPEMEEES